MANKTNGSTLERFSADGVSFFQRMALDSRIRTAAATLRTQFDAGAVAGKMEKFAEHVQTGRLGQASRQRMHVVFGEAATASGLDQQMSREIDVLRTALEACYGGKLEPVAA